MREFAGGTWELLIEWGLWSRDGRSSLFGASPMLAIMNLPTRRRAPDINDEVALRVDRIIGQLRHQDLRRYQVVELTFVRGWSQREIAGALRLSDRSVGKLTAGAVGWIEGRLSAFSDAA